MDSLMKKETSKTNWQVAVTETIVDEKIEDGDFSAFVKASKSTTQGYPHRLIRIKTLIKVLRDVK